MALFKNPSINDPNNSELDTQALNDSRDIKKYGSKKWIKRLLLLVFVVIVACGGWYAYKLTGNSPSKSATKMIEAIMKNDSQTAYKLTSATFQQNTTSEQLKSSLNQISPYLNGGSYQQSDHYNWVKDGQIYSTSLVYLITANNKTYYIRLLLDKSSQEKWLVSVFRVSETALKATEE